MFRWLLGLTGLTTVNFVVQFSIGLLALVPGCRSSGSLGMIGRWFVHTRARGGTADVVSAAAVIAAGGPWNAADTRFLRRHGPGER